MRLWTKHYGMNIVLKDMQSDLGYPAMSGLAQSVWIRDFARYGSYA